jgi:hypothetical protein
MDGIRITKKGLQAFIKYKILNDRRWTLRTLVVIYNGQSEEEKRFSASSKRNNLGFNKIDAGRLSKVAERYKRHKAIGDSDFRMARALLPKYWEQVLNVSDRPKLEAQYRKYIIEQERLIEGC